MVCPWKVLKHHQKLSAFSFSRFGALAFALAELITMNIMIMRNHWGPLKPHIFRTLLKQLLKHHLCSLNDLGHADNSAVFLENIFFLSQEINTSLAAGRKIIICDMHMHNRPKQKHVNPWLWWDFMMAFSCILIIPSALPKSLSHVPQHKCSCLIASEDVLVCLYESNLRISA